MTNSEKDHQEGIFSETQEDVVRIYPDGKVKKLPRGSKLNKYFTTIMKEHTSNDKENKK